MTIVEVAIPCPLYQTFDYYIKDYEPSTSSNYLVGARAQVMFGRRKVVGIITAVKTESTFPKERLKPITELIDREGVIEASLLKLAWWIARYYHEPIGEVLALFLPALLRRGESLTQEIIKTRLTVLGAQWVESDAAKRSHVKRAILEALKAQDWHSNDQLDLLFPTYRQNHRRALLGDGLIEEQSFEKADQNQDDYSWKPKAEGEHVLSASQQEVIDLFIAGETKPYLLEGVTGSGKTAVYIEIARHYLMQGKQVLFLVPEIGLTPQFIARIEQSLDVPHHLVHSQVSERHRVNGWQAAKSGEAALIIGTRSALFTPFKNLGVIIIDEAHDQSYIQQDGVRYSAHNSAIKRAHELNIPILLGTATPTLETLKNVELGAFGALHLPERIKGNLPQWRVIDCNEEPVFDGLTHPLLNAIEAALAKKEQILVFINRRGFSPVLNCGSCGWMAECDQCSAFLTYHRASHKLHCHHCDWRKEYPEKCPKCGDNHFRFIGEGTQRIEKALADAFPLANVMRFDRDSITNNRELHAELKRIRDHEVDIIIGTQMLAKGHDFENLSLVALVNSDGLFFSNDFRADEKLAQLLMQVSGRAGRSEERKGELIIQTYFPNHELFQKLPVVGYHQYANELLTLRSLLELPPYSHQALLQAEAKNENEAIQYLKGIINASGLNLEACAITPIIPNALNRRKGYYRVYSIMQSKSRQLLHQNLYRIMMTAEQNRKHQIRFFVEVDPIDFG